MHGFVLCPVLIASCIKERSFVEWAPREKAAAAYLCIYQEFCEGGGIFIVLYVRSRSRHVVCTRCDCVDFLHIIILTYIIRTSVCMQSCLHVYMPNSEVYNGDLEANYELLKEYVLEVAPAIPSLADFETAFLLLSISLNIHGETVFHMRGGKGKCREPCMHHELKLNLLLRLDPPATSVLHHTPHPIYSGVGKS